MNGGNDAAGWVAGRRVTPVRTAGAFTRYICHRWSSVWFLGRPPARRFLLRPLPLEPLPPDIALYSTAPWCCRRSTKYILLSLCTYCTVHHPFHASLCVRAHCGGCIYITAKREILFAKFIQYFIKHIRYFTFLNNVPTYLTIGIVPLGM